MRKYLSRIDKKVAMFFAFLIVVRLCFGYIVGVNWYAQFPHDDALLFEYAQLKTHFSSANDLSLVKCMGYPLFLQFNRFIHIPISITISLLWSVAALSVYSLLKKIVSNCKFVRIFAFVYILFLPVAFEREVGVKLYRNQIIEPLIIIVFSLIVSFAYDVFNNKPRILKSIVLGCSFTFLFYIKEDSIWMLPCMFVLFLPAFIKIIRKSINDKSLTKYSKHICCLLIPFMILFVSSNIYKAINYHYFGVYEIQTRTEGELGEFCSNIYKIKSDDTTYRIWASKDAIQKAFVASDTLRSIENLENAVLLPGWGRNATDDKEFILGDFLTWVLRLELFNTGNWTSEREVSDLFKQVNDELEEAFNNGTLEKNDLIFLLPSAGGKTPREILSLIPCIFNSFKNAIWYVGFEPGCISLQDLTNDPKYVDVSIVEHFTNENYLYNETPRIVDAEIVNKIITIVLNIYRFLNICLVFALIISFVININEIISKKKWKETSNIYMYLSLLFILFSFAYAFSINWFLQFKHASGFNYSQDLYYCMALPPFLFFAYMFAISSLFYRFGKISKRRHMLAD